MIKIINRKKYDTETATKLAGFYTPCNYRKFDYYCEELYRKNNGEYFLYGAGGPLTKYAMCYGDEISDGEDIFPFTEEEAQEWAMENIKGEEYIAIFGDVEE